MTEMRKLPRSQMTAWKVRQIHAQGGIDPISGRPFDMANLKDAVIDHDHITGEIRGVLLRSSNAVEGKVKEAIARWGGVGEDYSKIIPYMKRIIAYLEGGGTGWIYPFHKTAEERREARNKQARERRAEHRARREVLARTKGTK